MGHVKKKLNPKSEKLLNPLIKRLPVFIREKFIEMAAEVDGGQVVPARAPTKQSFPHQKSRHAKSE